MKLHKLSDTILCNLDRTARISKIGAIRFFDKHEDFHINFYEFVIMEALYINPEIHQRDLARILVKGTANLSRDLEKLENKGLIKRLAGTREKRIVKTLMLTSEGERIYQEVSGRIYNHISEIENIFSKEEREQFLFLISKLQNRLTESSDMIYD